MHSSLFAFLLSIFFSFVFPLFLLYVSFLLYSSFDYFSLFVTVGTAGLLLLFIADVTLRAKTSFYLVL
jgi:hypothetical protein